MWELNGGLRVLVIVCPVPEIRVKMRKRFVGEAAKCWLTLIQKMNIQQVKKIR